MVQCLKVRKCCGDYETQVSASNRESERPNSNLLDADMPRRAARYVYAVDIRIGIGAKDASAQEAEAIKTRRQPFEHSPEEDRPTSSWDCYAWDRWARWCLARRLSRDGETESWRMMAVAPQGSKLSRLRPDTMGGAFNAAVVSRYAANRGPQTA